MCELGIDSNTRSGDSVANLQQPTCVAVGKIDRLVRGDVVTYFNNDRYVIADVDGDGTHRLLSVHDGQAIWVPRQLLCALRIVCMSDTRPGSVDNVALASVKKLKIESLLVRHANNKIAQDPFVRVKANAENIKMMEAADIIPQRLVSVMPRYDN